MAKFRPFLMAAALLAACQIIATILIAVGHLPVSVPVLGMFLLLLVLVRTGETPKELRNLTRWLLRWLTLLFVPAGVGVMLYLEPLRHQWLALIVTMLVSTAIAMAFTGWLLQQLLVRTDRQKQTAESND